MTIERRALSGGKRDERSGYLIDPESGLLRAHRDMLTVFEAAFPNGVYSEKIGRAFLPVTMLLALAAGREDSKLSFLVYDANGIEPLGACLGYDVRRNHFDQREDVSRIELLGAVPGSMAGNVAMRELMGRISIKRKPVEFQAYSKTTGKILKRSTAKKALHLAGWEAERLGGGIYMRLEPKEYAGKRPSYLRLEQLLG